MPPPRYTPVGKLATPSPPSPYQSRHRRHHSSNRLRHPIHIVPPRHPPPTLRRHPQQLFRRIAHQHRPPRPLQHRNHSSYPRSPSPPPPKPPFRCQLRQRRHPCCTPPAEYPAGSGPAPDTSSGSAQSPPPRPASPAPARLLHPRASTPAAVPPPVASAPPSRTASSGSAPPLRQAPAQSAAHARYTARIRHHPPSNAAVQLLQILHHQRPRASSPSAPTRVERHHQRIPKLPHVPAHLPRRCHIHMPPPQLRDPTVRTTAPFELTSSPPPSTPAPAAAASRSRAAAPSPPPPPPPPAPPPPPPASSAHSPARPPPSSVPSISTATILTGIPSLSASAYSLTPHCHP